jgi:NhaP-type Na+/H+ or K+/H+ antiporter
MTETIGAAAFATLVLLFAASANGLRRLWISAPLVFVAVGAAIAVIGGAPSSGELLWMRVVAEVTLAYVLFHDAAQVRPQEIGRERRIVVRLLFVSLPLAILLGYLLARAVFPGMPVLVAFFIAAALAPTDPALGAATVLNPRVPVRVRRILNVESGLNDGIVAPVVLFAVAALAEGQADGLFFQEAFAEIALGAVVGALVGVGGGVLLGLSRVHRTSTGHTREIGVLMLPIIAFTGASAVHGNGFVSAFVAGTALAGSSAWLHKEEGAVELTETLSEPLSFAVWLFFGLAAFPLVRDHVGWVEVAYAVLSLTLVRMIPVAMALLGTGLAGPSVAFIGWFGPRGLATVIFGTIAAESMEPNEYLYSALGVLAITVLLSVIAHGLSADPLAERYARWVERAKPAVETAESVEPVTRSRSRLWPGRRG